MDTNKMREQFEAAYDRGDFLCMDGPYDNPRKNQALAIWIASREAVVVELPDLDRPSADGMGALFACKKAIEAQGMKVAP